MVELATGRLRERLPAVNGPQAEGLAFTAGGRRLVTGGFGGTVSIWDLPTREVIRRLPHGAGDLAFSADGAALVALGCCHGGSVIAAWETSTGQPRFVRRSQGKLTAFALLPDARRLLVGDDDGGVETWDLRTARATGPKTTVGSGGVSQIAVTPDGERFAVGTYDGIAALWDLRTVKRIGEASLLERGNAPAVVLPTRPYRRVCPQGASVAPAVGAAP